jgi:FAD/FMN-containing dehydrogenase
VTQSAVDTLRRELISVVGDRHVLADPDLTRPYEYDWTGRFGARARLVVRPQSSAEVAGVISSCHAAGVAVVPQGGNTGLVGGGVPRGGEILLSLQRLQNLAPVDNARGLVQVGAGVTLGTLQHHARQAGFDAALDLGARDRATIGGLVACDAGGARALRYGTARARVAGLEAVLADGSIIQRLDGLTKDNAGYDVPSLLIGSEGTLAVITRVLWKLGTALQRAVAALVPLTDAHDAAHLVSALRIAAPSLDACELLTDVALKLVLAQHRRRSPVPDAPLYALVELASNHDPLDELAAAFELAGIEDAAIADDTASRQQLCAGQRQPHDYGQAHSATADDHGGGARRYPRGAPDGADARGDRAADEGGDVEGTASGIRTAADSGTTVSPANVPTARRG